MQWQQAFADKDSECGLSETTWNQLGERVIEARIPAHCWVTHWDIFRTPGTEASLGCGSEWGSPELLTPWKLFQSFISVYFGTLSSGFPLLQADYGQHKVLKPPKTSAFSDIKALCAGIALGELVPVKGIHASQWWSASSGNQSSVFWPPTLLYVNPHTVRWFLPRFIVVLLTFHSTKITVPCRNPAKL